ncbi:MAG: DUF5698 domain-containing protein [Chloroflexi bacterium]|nr:DUF5698 domain-containing protein [Chloroflexota bacterium]
MIENLPEVVDAFLLPALSIFIMRITDISLYTLRLLMTLRGRKAPAWIFGFFQGLLFVTVIRIVLANMDNWANILGYACGFATGLVAGMLIEQRLALGHAHFRIFSSRQGMALTGRLREAGFAVTEVPAHGKDGTVTLLECKVLRKHSPQVQQLVEETDPEAFVTVEDVRPVQRGFWG